MKNKMITIYELMGLIKDDKVPKKIKIDNREYDYNLGDYYSTKGVSLLNDYNLRLCSIEEILEAKVEILSEENEMKEMIYQKDRKVEILYSGTYKGYDFYIMNLGTHPTAYVNVCNNKLLNGKECDKLDIDVHGGLTYSEDELYINDEKEKVKGWFIGWDYAHYNDYAGYEMDMREEIRSNGKKWTTEEIYEDVKDVIEQCINCKPFIEINDIKFNNKEEAIDYVNNYFIPEKNDEWEDICELLDDSRYNFSDRQNGMTQDDRRLLDSNFKTLGETINQLIKNQRKIIEKLESKNEKRNC